MDMIKFEDISDPGFIAVTGELRRWVRELTAPSQSKISVTIVPHQEVEYHPQDRIC
jgi:hypothetical protein